MERFLFGVFCVCLRQSGGEGAGGTDLDWFRVQPCCENPISNLVVVRFHIGSKVWHGFRRAVVRIKRIGGVTLVIFVFLVLLDKNRARTFSARMNAFLGSLFFLAFSFTFRVAGATTCGAPGHLHSACLPVYLRVVFLEPGIAQNNTLLTQLCYGEQGAFGMSVVPEGDIRNLGYSSRLIWGSVDIKNRDGSAQGASRDVVLFHILSVHEQPIGSTVQ